MKGQRHGDEKRLSRQWFDRWIKTCLKNGLLANLCILLLAAGAYADELIMKNGDRLQGTVVCMESGKLEFKATYAGTITVKWEEIARLMTE